jgi:hypothetical protein
MLATSYYKAVVAEEAGRIIGCNFLLTGPVGGIGPVGVVPEAWSRGIGLQLKRWALEHAATLGITSVRGVQSAFNGRTLSLNVTLGFDVREAIACLQGEVRKHALPGHSVRGATPADENACLALCRDIYGHERRVELAEALALGGALVVERDGALTGYATDIGLLGHAVGRANSDLMALIAGANQVRGLGLLLPMTNSELFRWCLANGLRYVHAKVLMSHGSYSAPAGPYLPSITY